MGQFGNYNNEKKKKTTSTNGVQFYNKELGSTLITGMWEGCATLKICPVLPQDKQTKTNTYDYDVFVNAVLTQEKLYDLAQICKIVIATVNSGSYEFEPMGIPTGSGYVEIAPGQTYDKPEGTIALAIYNGIDADGKAENKLVYVFNKSNFFKNYAGSGQYDKSDYYEAEFNRFYIIINETIKAMTNAVAHTIATRNRYTTDSIISSLAALKEKSGISSFKSGQVNTYFGSVNNEKKNTENLGTVEFGGTVVEERLPI